MSRFIARLSLVISQRVTAKSAALPKRIPAFIRPVSTSQEGNIELNFDSCQYAWLVGRSPGCKYSHLEILILLFHCG